MGVIVVSSWHPRVKIRGNIKGIIIPSESSCIGDSKEAAEGLKKCTGMLRHHLATTLNLRITPELNFVKDGSIEHGARIAKLLEEVMGEEK